MSRRGSKPSRCGNKKQKISNNTLAPSMSFQRIEFVDQTDCRFEDRERAWPELGVVFARISEISPRQSAECRTAVSNDGPTFSRMSEKPGILQQTGCLVDPRSGRGQRNVDPGPGQRRAWPAGVSAGLAPGEPFTSGYQAPFLTHPLRGSGRRRWPTSLPSRHPVPVPAGAENRRQQMDVTHGAGSLQDLAPTSARKTTAHELNLAPETASPWRLATDWITTGNYMHITQASYLVLSSHQIIYVVTPHVTLWCPSKNKYKLSVWWGLPSLKHPYLMKAFRMPSGNHY